MSELADDYLMASLPSIAYKRELFQLKNGQWCAKAVIDRHDYREFPLAGIAGTPIGAVNRLRRFIDISMESVAGTG